MNRIITAAAVALALFTGAAHANDCDSYTLRINSIATQIGYENGNVTRYTAMINASNAINDFDSAKMYASMGKNSAVRLLGHAAEFRDIMGQVKATPGQCGAKQSDMDYAMESVTEMETSIKEALAIYSKLPK